MDAMGHPDPIDGSHRWRRIIRIMVVAAVMTADQSSVGVMAMILGHFLLEFSRILHRSGVIL